MARIPQLRDEARLFVCGYVDVPLSSTNGIMNHAHVPTWALMKTGGIDLLSEHLGVLGLARDDHLSALVSERLENLLPSGLSCLQALATKHLASPVKGAVLSRFYGNEVFTRLQSRTQPFEPDIIRGAVLVPMERLASLSSKLKDGFYAFFTRKDLVRMIRQRKVSTRTVPFQGKKVKIITSLREMGIITGPNGIRGGWSYDVEDIKFLSAALSKWEEESRRERRAQMNEASKIQYA